MEPSTPQPLTTGCREQVPAATDQQPPAFRKNELKKTNITAVLSVIWRKNSYSVTDSAD